MAVDVSVSVAPGREAGSKGLTAGRLGGSAHGVSSSCAAIMSSMLASPPNYSINMNVRALTLMSLRTRSLGAIHVEGNIVSESEGLEI